MIDQLLIMDSGGIPLFEYSVQIEKKDSSLISGFLTALNVFAQGERGEQLRKITLDPTTFYFEKDGSLLFVILTKDPAFEKVIGPILLATRQKFLTQFNIQLSNLTGDISIFNSFQQTLNSIFSDFGYFDYLNARQSYEKDTSMQSLILIDRKQGELLYLKSKTYLDRNALGFQTPMLFQTGNRIFNDILKERLVSIALVTYSMRCVILKESLNAIFLQEKQHPTFPESSDLIKNLTEKKIQANLKHPGRFIFDYPDPFIMYDLNGKNLLHHDPQQLLKQSETVPDFITLERIAETILQQNFKEKLFSVIAFCQNVLYLIVPILNSQVVIRLACESHQMLPGLVQKMNACSELDLNQTQDFTMLLTQIVSFLKYWK